MAQRKRGRGGDHYKHSLCWYCIHAYGDDCFALPVEERTWIKTKKQKKIKWPEGYKTVWQVKECERFQGGRKPFNPPFGILRNSPLFATVLSKKLKELAR